MLYRTNYTPRSEILNVWARIINDRILGLYFINNITRERYLELFRANLQSLNIQYLNPQNQDISHITIWFQQVGAPLTMCFLFVTRYLDKGFPQREIGR